MSRKQYWKVLYHTIILAALGACGQQTETRTPVLDETSMVVLRRQADRALADVQEARRQIERSREDAVAAVERAEADLKRLCGYYLPMLEVSQRADKAYRLYTLGETNVALSELEIVESELLTMAKSEEEFAIEELERPLERAVDARLAISGSSEDARDKLDALVNQLQAMLVKGGLIVR